MKRDYRKIPWVSKFLTMERGVMPDTRRYHYTYNKGAIYGIDYPYQIWMMNCFNQPLSRVRNPRKKKVYKPFFTHF